MFKSGSQSLKCLGCEESKKQDAQLPLSSLCLLVPPVRLISACMWQVAKQCNVEQYGKLVDFITLVTEMVPELLSPKQKCQLILGLRARITLDMLQNVKTFDLQAVQDHLSSVQCWTNNSVQEQSQEELLKMSTFVELVETLLSHPSEREQFFKVVFPVQYGPSFDTTLQILVWEFFSRLEEFFPVPSFSQVASSQGHSLSDLKQCDQYISNTEDLKRLLVSLNHRQQHLNKSQPSCNSDSIVATILPKQTSEVCSDGDEQHILSERRAGKGWRRAEVQMKRGRERTGKKMQWQDTNFAEDEDFHGEKTEGADRWSKAAVAGKDVLQKQQDSYSLNRETCQEVCSETAGDAVVQEPGASESPATRLTICWDLSRERETSEANGTLDSAEDGPITFVPFSGKPKSSGTKRAKEHTCPECGKSFKFLYLLKQHGGVHSAVRPFQCSQCEKTFKSKKSLKSHCSIHSAEASYQCDQCEKRFKSQNGLKQHLQFHTGKSGETGQFHKKYTCLQCGKTFGYQSNFKRHSSVHSAAQPFPCSLCEKRFKTKDGLKVHLQSHAGVKPFACLYCSRKFQTSQVLKSHLRTHTGERPFACTLCDRKFTQSNLLTVHLRMHKKEKPYLCSVCGKSFYYSGALLVHSRIHTGERPHHCNYCGKAYITSTRLAIHLRYHTGERPYPCSQCGKSFHTTSTLKKHARTHTGEKPFQCLKCGKTFSQRSNMKVHLRSHDNGHHTIL